MRKARNPRANDKNRPVRDCWRGEVIRHLNIADENGRYGMVGRSSRMVRVYEAMDAVAGTPMNVLIAGPTGTGKELAARGIFKNSDYRNAFVAVNCPALAESLAESELFGHERGAFTGAFTARKGMVECAHKGTLFLNEVDKLSYSNQAKLLRVLQERVNTPVGSNRSVPVDFRLICDTNVALDLKVAKRDFREDLYYRIAVFRIDMPPLRERDGDVELLTQHTIEKYNREFGLQVSGASRHALKFLNDYHWPGNVRELDARIGSAMTWKRLETAKGSNGHGEHRLEYDDLMRVWEGYVGPAAIHTDPLNLDFDRDIAVPYKSHMITRSQAEAMIQAGLEYTNGSYMRLVTEVFHRPRSDYKRIMDTLRRNDLLVDFRLYRNKQ